MSRVVLCVLLFAPVFGQNSLGTPQLFPSFPFMQPIPMVLPQVLSPGQLPPPLLLLPHNQVHLHTGRPSGPQGEDQLQTQTNAQTSSQSSTLMGSLSSTGMQAMQSAHSMFNPPYSWMWRVALSAASMKYDNMDKIADVPELLNLITGYYIGAPDAVQAARAAAENPADRFSLTSLSHLFQGQASSFKSTETPSYDSASESSSMSWPFSALPGMSSSSPSSSTGTEWTELDNDEESQQNGSVESTMANMFSNMMGGKPTHSQSVPKPQPSGMEQMIKMAAPALGLNPTLVNMAVPMIGSML